MFTACFRGFLALTLFLGTGTCVAQESDPFLPTWKLLSPEAKEQFIAGYLQGWRDAEKVTDIATQYVKENPQKALEGLEKIRALYDMSAYKSSAIVEHIDLFYKDPSNASSSLSKAVSGARQRLNR